MSKFLGGLFMVLLAVVFIGVPLLILGTIFGYVVLPIAGCLLKVVAFFVVAILLICLVAAVL